MKAKVINAQISSDKTYQMYLRQFLNLAENVFVFENLPEMIDESYLNKSLTRKGSIAFFKDEELGVLALPYTILGKLDVYNRPTNIKVQGLNGYTNTLSRDNFVIMYDNNARYPLVLDIYQLAMRMSLAVRINDVNLFQQKTPRVWTTTKEQELSLKKALNEIDSLSEDVVTLDSLLINNVNSILTPAPYLVDKVDLHIKEILAELYRLVGISNLQEQKKERVISDEISVSQGGTIASRFSRFAPIKKAIEQIKSKFGLNISV